MRTVIALLEVDNDRAIKEDLGTIDYVQREMGWVQESGIYLSEVKILDYDDSEDKEAINLINHIFSM